MPERSPLVGASLLLLSLLLLSLLLLGEHLAGALLAGRGWAEASLAGALLWWAQIAAALGVALLRGSRDKHGLLADSARLALHLSLIHI